MNTASINEGIDYMVTNKYQAGIVTNESGTVAGIFTPTDVLNYYHKCHLKSDPSFATHSIDTVMTPSERLVYCSPADSVHRCREMMFQLRIRNIAVIEKNLLLGVINIRDLSDSTFDVSDGSKRCS